MVQDFEAALLTGDLTGPQTPFVFRGLSDQVANGGGESAKNAEAEMGQLTIIWASLRAANCLETFSCFA